MENICGYFKCPTVVIAFGGSTKSAEWGQSELAGAADQDDRVLCSICGRRSTSWATRNINNNNNNNYVKRYHPKRCRRLKLPPFGHPNLPDFVALRWSKTPDWSVLNMRRAAKLPLFMEWNQMGRLKVNSLRAAIFSSSPQQRQQQQQQQQQKTF